MATYVNNLRLKEIATGDEDGTWGTSTNTNLELITDAFSYGTKQLAADANETFTVPDGTADDIRAFYVKFTSAVSLTATRTVTLGPNTVSKVWVIENATTGGQAITIAQGSGATATVANGDKVMIVSDGAGASAAVYVALTSGTAETYSDAGNVSGATNISFDTDVTEVTLTGNTTFSFTDLPDSGTPKGITLIVNQDGSGGHSVDWAAAAVYAGGVQPPESTGANDQDIWTISTVDGGTTLYVSLAIKDAS